MIPDELRRAIIHELDGMVSEFIHPNEFGGYDVDYGQLADAVMPLIEAQGVEIAELRADRDMHLRARLDVEKILDKALGTEVEDGAGAGLVGDVALLADRLNLALWLHAESQWRRTVETEEALTMHLAQAESLRRTRDMLLDAINHAAGLAEQVDRQRDTITAKDAEIEQARRILRYVDELAVRLKVKAEMDGLRAERDRLSTLLRGMARRASWLRQGWDSAERVIKRVKAELAELRERAVVLPEDWRIQVDATRPSQITTLIESWRPSTGDTDGTPRPPLDDATKAEVLAAIEAGQFIACGDGPEYWPDCERCDATGRITDCPDCEGIGKVRPAALSEGLAEPEPAWGEDRPVHGHTEQTGDQT